MDDKSQDTSLTPPDSPSFGICRVCQQDWGDPLLCDECDGAYHLSCLDPPLTTVPENDWYCADCANAKEKAQNTSAVQDDDEEIDPYYYLMNES